MSNVPVRDDKDARLTFLRLVNLQFLARGDANVARVRQLTCFQNSQQINSGSLQMDSRKLRLLKSRVRRQCAGHSLFRKPEPGSRRREGLLPCFENGESGACDDLAAWNSSRNRCNTGSLSPFIISTMAANFHPILSLISRFARNLPQLERDYN
jgi:hypothetical protein